MIPPFAEYIQTIARAGDAYNKETFGVIGLGSCHADYIRTICRNPGISQETLSRYIGVDKSNITRNLVQLETAEYVERRPNPSDRRSTLVYPTDKAYELLPVIVETQSDWRAILTKGFSAEEKEQLGELLERMEDNVRRYRLGVLDEEEEF